MSEEQNAQPEVTKDTSNKPEVTKQGGEKPKVFGNSVAGRTREDIYDRFDAQSAPKAEGSSDASSVTEESNSDKDLKKESDSVHTSDKVIKDTEKPTSVKKGEEPKDVSGEHKMVPLQALHESRERFKKLNLEYREYKNTQTKEFQSLKDQLNKLQDTLKSPASSTENDLVDEESETVKQLRREILVMKQTQQEGTKNNDQEAALKAQQEQQKKIQTVSDDLAKEGYKGFDFALLKTGAKLQELVNVGELTEKESTEPEMWKKVYKEHIYPEVKSLFVEQDKSETMEKKKERKAKAQLVSDPGKAPDKPEEEEKTPQTFDGFVKSQVKERMEDQRKKFYKRMT